jgi:membrane associated rhomboid family serine protease
VASSEQPPQKDPARPRRLSRPGRSRIEPVLTFLLVLSILPELVLQAAEFGLWDTGPLGLRDLVYQNGAFWPGLLSDWKPNYPGQPALMFLTYGFLHAGLWHLALNMMTLVSLGQLLIVRMGQKRFLLFYVLSIFGGAVGYALMSRGVQPMVGASGALFGLAAGVIGCDIVDRIEEGDPARSILRMISAYFFGLIMLNILMYYVMGGQLAWQTHLGGFAAGWVLVALLDKGNPPPASNG